jgi:hypothetical protein
VTLGRRKIIAVCLISALVALCTVTVAWLSDTPLLLFRKMARNEKAAAIAIRDNVIAFQKFGSRLFTYPLLQRSYGEVVYLTEYKAGEKQGEFTENLRRLLATHEQVDIFLLAHANEYYRWVAEVDSASRTKIRLVYNTGCGGTAQAAQWLDLGATSYVAHPGSESLSPVFYFYFLRRWCAGYSVAEAATEANRLLEDALSASGEARQVSGSRAVTFGASHYSLHDERQPK